MPYFLDSQTWLQQSLLLLSARPTTAHITTQYRISPAPKASVSASALASKQPPVSTSTSTPTPPIGPGAGAGAPTSRAHVILKTYDPASGVCLKYRTDKAAEVGRLVGALARCGRVMSGQAEGLAQADEKGEEASSTAAAATPAPAVKAEADAVGTKVEEKPAAAVGKGKEGGKKKKKGKR
ncbi:MAG: hypothetical protein LQ351_003296 [Letrouitia transgressa]|nr:MAG: hypothetical protein LQ351_003296 [Letrouitia transgressa]